MKEGEVQAMFVPGQPVAKGRPRMTMTGRVYTPKKTEIYEAKLRTHAIGKGLKKIEKGVPVELCLIFYMAIPKSWSKKKKAMMEGRPCASSIDLDNKIKVVGDALNGICWHDDRQIYRIKATKLYSVNPGVGIRYFTATFQ